MENPTQGNSTAGNGAADNNAAETQTSLMDVIDNSKPTEGVTPAAKPAENGDKANGNNTPDEKTQLPAWTQQLPEEMRSNAEMMAQLGKFQKIGDMAKSYSELEAKLGKTLTKPGENSSPEEVQAFYEKLGKPSSADGYPMTGEDAKAFRELAFRNNLTADQAENLYGELKQIATNAVQQNRTALENAAAETQKQLQKEYGADYNKKMEMLKRGIMTYGGQELYDQLKNSGLITKPNICKMYILLGEQSAEAGSSTGSSARPEGYKDTAQGGHFDFKYD